MQVYELELTAWEHYSLLQVIGSQEVTWAAIDAGAKLFEQFDFNGNSRELGIIIETGQVGFENPDGYVHPITVNKKQFDTLFQWCTTYARFQNGVRTQRLKQKLLNFKQELDEGE